MGLDRCFYLRNEINEIDEKISELHAVSCTPKTQIISFTPSRGGATINRFDAYLIKLERLKIRRCYLETEICKQWRITEAQLKEIEATEDQIELLQYRFFHGLPWKTCCDKVQNNYPNERWNESKVFRTYRNILKKLYNDIEIDCKEVAKCV